MHAIDANGADPSEICSDIASKFEALALELGRALGDLPEKERGGDAWARLYCARATAEEGAALARGSLSSAGGGSA